MAATFQFMEQDGAGSGSPSQGTPTSARSDCNWKSIDDSTSAYSSYPIQAGTNSYTKYQYGNFSGSYNTISNVLWGHTNGMLGTGLTLLSLVTSTYTQPTTRFSTE